MDNDRKQEIDLELPDGEKIDVVAPAEDDVKINAEEHDDG